VLDCALRYLSGADTASLPLTALLADLARAFAATDAGVAQLPGGEPVARTAGAAAAPLPWQDRPELLTEVAASASAVGVRRADRGWLLAAVAGEGADWLLWLEAPLARAWSARDEAALALTGQALARRLRRPEGASRWAHQLLRRGRQHSSDEAAVAVRRVAHDYGNILTAILGFSELALSQAPPDDPSASYLNEIHRAAQVGQRLTNMVRLFTRRSWPRNQPARLPAVAADEARRLREQFPGTHLDVALPGDLPPLAIDPEPLRHILAQLLDNAAEAVAAGGSVRLSARPVALALDECLDLAGTAEPGAHVEVAVEDSGCGLSADARRRLLVEPFFTTKTRHRGYGLGAALGILSAHRGGLLVEPAAGGGTVARAWLPVAPPVVPPPGERLLVVDDDPLVLQLVRATLERAGYRVETAASAADALRAFTGAAEPFRLVLADVAVPCAGGFDLARQLRAHDAGVIVLFMGGPPGPGRPPPGGAPELLTKPFRPEGLVRAVRSALGRGPHRAGRPKGRGRSRPFRDTLTPE
jgi:signal transduction histidine kinase/CheY-like chemotaxis protein